MKHLLCLFVLSAVVPFALLAGKAAKPPSATLVATTCNVGTSQPCVLIFGSGYAAGKNVTIEVVGAATSETFVAPANASGNIALYIYEDYAPGYYTVTSYQGSKVLTLTATTGFDVV